ncbi:MAG: protein kinase [Myxococcota bacterium]
MSPMKLAVGARVDRYIIESRLGEGGMAEVWGVRHQLLGTMHALKVLLSLRGRHAERLLREGRTQASLQHPNLLPVRDVLDIDGTPGLLMPFIDGPPLSRFIRARSMLREEALATLRAITEGLRFAHERGFVHRDLKPGNVLIDLRHEAFQPRISDFGLVKEVAAPEQTMRGAVLGTLSYAAPEQLEDSASVTTKADMFSLGAMMVELLTGAPLYAHRSLGAALDARRQPPDLSRVPSELRDVIAALLSTDPVERPDCATVLAALPANVGVLLSAQGALYRDAVEMRRVPHSRESTLLFSRTEDLFSSMPQRTHNLPGPRDRFIGRAELMDEAQRRIEGGARLLSLLGPGGVGKTRLALEMARRGRDGWPGGVWFCDLSDAADAQDVVSAMGRALGMRLEQLDVDEMGAVLQRRGRSLVVLDNFEQVVQAAAHTVGRWLDLAPAAVFVVTSREPLLLRGEQRLLVDVLPEQEAIELFRDRAAAVQRDDSPEEIRSLVRLLDQLPLAIELAAARATTMPARRIRQRLTRRFDLLKSRVRDRPDRHRSLQAALEWSWDLLRPIERAALSQCSVFEGGFSMGAAEEILALDDIDPDAWVEDVIAELVERSLLRGVQAPAMRLQMLISIQEFARERLDNETAQALRLRHAQAFARSGRQAVGRQRGPDGASWWRRMRADLGNFFAAARWAMANERPELAAENALYAGMVYGWQGPIERGIDQLREALELPLPPPLRARILLQLAAMLEDMGQSDAALELYEDAQTHCHAHGLDVLLARAVAGLLHIEGTTKSLDGVQHFDEAAALLRRLPRPQRPDLLRAIAATHLRRREWDAAEMLLLEALQISQSHQDRYGIFQVRASLADLYWKQDQLEDALIEHQRRLDDAFSRLVPRERGHTLIHRGHVLRRLSRRAEALNSYEEALAIYRRLGSLRLEADALHSLAIMSMDIGQLEEVLGYFQRALEVYQASRLVERQQVTLHNIGVLQNAMCNFRASEAAFREAIAFAEAHTHPERAAQSRKWLGEVRWQMGDPDGARILEDNHRISLENNYTDLIVTCRLSLGHYHMHAGRLDEATEWFTAARDYSFNLEKYYQGAAMLGMGELLLEKGQVEDAITTLEAAIDMHGNVEGDNARAAFALALAHRGDHERAKLEIARSIEAFSGVGAGWRAVLRCHRAQIRALAGDGDGSAADLRDAQQMIDSVGPLPAGCLLHLEMAAAQRAVAAILGDCAPASAG